MRETAARRRMQATVTKYWRALCMSALQEGLLSPSERQFSLEPEYTSETPT